MASSTMSGEVAAQEVAAQAAAAQVADEQRTGMPSRIFALMPLWVLLIVSAFSPDFFNALRVAPPDIVGIPLAILVEVAALFWMLIGFVVISMVPSRLVESLALTAFTIPATVVVVLTPAVIGVLQNRN